MKKIFLALTLALVAPAVCWAGNSAKDASLDKEMMDKRMRTMRTVGLAELLNLSESDAIKMSEVLRPFDEQRRPLHEQIKSAADVLNRAAQGEAVSSADVDDATTKIFDARTQLAAIDRAQFQAITKGMSSRDRAKVAVFFAKFRHDQHRPDRDEPGHGGPAVP